MQVHRPGRADRVVGTPELQDDAPLAPRLLRVLGVLLAAVAVGAAAAWTTSRPVAEVVEPPPTFDPAAHPDDPVGLPVAGVGARGTLDGADGPPADVLDGEPGTAWVAEEPGAQDPPVLTLSLDEPAWLVRVVVVNDGADGAAPVRRLLLRTPDGAQVRLELLDLSGTQEVDLPEPLLVERIDLVVEQGTEAGPVALAEVALVGHPAAAGAAAGDGGQQVEPADGG